MAERVAADLDQRTEAQREADAEDVFRLWIRSVPAGIEWGCASDHLTRWIAADEGRLAAFRRDHERIVADDR